MNALQILRETVRVLCGDPHTFTSILFLLLCLTSGCLLLSAAALVCALYSPPSTPAIGPVRDISTARHGRFPRIPHPPPPHLSWPWGFPASIAVAFPLTVRDTIGEEVLRMFLKERQLHDDFVTKISDMVWRRNGGNVDAVEATTDQGSAIEVAQPEDNWQNESDKRKELNLLKYEALKDELLLLTTGIGAACSLYCLLVFSLETDVSYALGVGFSCLYLQLLCQHADNLSKQDIPQVFLKKKVKKIGITSEDLKNTIEKTLGGGGVALSSPRLVIPTVIFGLSALIDHFKNSFFSFEVLPRMMGFLAYKVAALVQVYRDNEDLRLILHEEEDADREST
ncbi:hypothetical protein ZEAMMB73_Zm00001d037921 [Zea mays]|uniref:Uncharacterized protein n=1 Tax=Zea mays TaxID=4577 RepID=A0A1D6M1T2_MAIZE|nr:hypothetical protein ZEAMMB73_Zm00001d037921 [Zea mays]